MFSFATIVAFVEQHSVGLDNEKRYHMAYHRKSTSSVWSRRGSDEQINVTYWSYIKYSMSSQFIFLVDGHNVVFLHLSGLINVLSCLLDIGYLFGHFLHWYFGLPQQSLNYEQVCPIWIAYYSNVWLGLFIYFNMMLYSN